MNMFQAGLPGQAQPKKQIGVDPTSGHLTLDGVVMDNRDPRMWGTAGYLGSGTTDSRAGNSQPINEQYFNPDGEVTDEAGNVTRNYAMKPETQERLGNLRQVEQGGVGGWNEAIDPSKLTWDDEFGVMSDPSNIKEDDPAGANRARLVRTAILLMGGAAAGGYLPGSEGGIMGAFGGTGEGALQLAGPGVEGGGAIGGAAEGSSGLTQLSGPGMGGGGGSAGGSFLDSLPDWARSAYDSVSNIPSSARDLFQGSTSGGEGMDWSSIFGGGPQQLSGPGMEGITGAVGSTGGSAAGSFGGNFLNSNLARLIGAGITTAQGSRGASPDQRAGQDRDYAERMWRERLAASRPDQENALGTRQWVQDPQTGKWTQKDALNPAEQQRLDLYRQIALGRMNQANGIDISNFGKPINWGGVNPGLGRIYNNLYGPAAGGGVLGGGK